MATNYAELKAKVATWLNRADLTANIPDYINDGMQRVGFELASSGGLQDQEQVAFATTVAAQDSLPVPNDYQLLRYIKVTSNSVPEVLEAATYDRLIDLYGDTPGAPEKYAVFDASFFFRPIPDGAYTVQIGYIKKYPALVNDADTNWLLQNGGNVLLYAACLEASPQLMDDPRVQVWGGAYKEAVRLMLAADRRSKRGPKPAGVVMPRELISPSSTWSILNG